VLVAVRDGVDELLRGAAAQLLSVQASGAGEREHTCRLAAPLRRLMHGSWED